MKFQNTLISLFVVSTLAACGGSSSSSTADDDDTGGETLASVSGKAADGYLSNAKVCLDLNGNKTCDSNEPSEMTGEGGVFTLTGYTQAQIDANPLLVEIIADQTIDEDEPGVVLTQGYKLSAPAGYTFVSPLTSLVQNEVDKGTSIANAETSVQGKLGTTLSLNEDYVAGTDDQANGDEFKKLHQVAQVTASIIADNMKQLEETAKTENIDLDKLVSLISNEVFDTLASVAMQVEDIAKDDSLTFDANKVATDIGEEFIELDGDKLEVQIAQNEAVNSSTTTSIADLITTGGINWFWGEKENDGYVNLEFGSVTVDSEGGFTDIEYEISEDGMLEQRNYEPEEGQLTLTSKGWVAEDDTITDVTLNEDGSIIFVMATTALNETVTGTEITLDELNVKNVLMNSGGDGSWAHAVPSDITFPEGSKAYQLMFEYTDERSIYSFNLGNWCETGDTARWEILNDSCNAVYLNGGWATTIDSLTKESAATSPYTELTSVSAVIGLPNGNVVTEILANGTVNFYNQGYDNSATKLDSGSWKDITVHGETLREISVPSSVATIQGQQWSNVNEDDNKLYLAVYDDFVRVVWADSDNSDGAEYTFNKIAKDFILDNASRENLLIKDPVTETPPAGDWPSKFTQEWVSGKTLYIVWYGADEDGDTPAAEVDQITLAENDAVKLQIIYPSESEVFEDTYRVRDDGLLYFVEEQEEYDSTEGNYVICSTEDYMVTAWATEVGVPDADGADLFFMDKQKALDYAATLNANIPFSCPGM